MDCQPTLLIAPFDTSNFDFFEQVILSSNGIKISKNSDYALGTNSRTDYYEVRYNIEDVDFPKAKNILLQYGKKRFQPS